MSRRSRESKWLVVGDRCSPNMVDAMKSTELSYSMVVEDLFWYTKGSFQGAGFPRELHGDRNRLPSEPARFFIPSPERHSQLQVVIPVVRIVRPFN